MHADPAWKALSDMLDTFEDANRAVRLWLRDDDAVEPTPALGRLLDITRNASVPLSLAVIPAFTGQPLADRLQDENHVTVTVHGWSHENHAGSRGKKCELGSDRPSALVLGELGDGLAKLRGLHGDRLDPVLVPPWNRIDSDLLPELPPLGFRAASVYGKSDTQSPIRLINTHVDIMEWASGRCRPHGDLVGLLLTELEQRRDGSDEPIGILTHHLVHDEACWDFLVKLFEVTAERACTRWLPLRALLS